MGLETPYIFAPLSLVVLTNEKLVKAAARLDQTISPQVGEGSFGAYALTAAFYPGRSIEQARNAAERKGLSIAGAEQRQALYNSAICQLAAVPAGKKGEVILSLGATILHRQMVGFPDHFGHVARGRLVQIPTSDNWSGVNGSAAADLYNLMGKAVHEEAVKEALASFAVRPEAPASSSRQRRMSADDLLRALLGEE